ncbi:MAG: hypothetical protein ABSD62_06400 [Candidatus Limnocylindrales bacterium]
MVLSHKPEAEMEKELAVDGSVTVTGMLRGDTKEIDGAVRTLGTRIDNVHVNRSILLAEGEWPADAASMYTLAIVSGVLGAPLLIGWLVGYVVFRPSKLKPQPGVGMAGRLPVRVTGLLVGPGAGLRARELRAELRLGEMNPAAAAAGTPPPIDLHWTREGYSPAVRLTPGLSQGVVGNASPFRGARPAIRVRFFGHALILSFDDEAARDAAYEQLLKSSWYASAQAQVPAPAQAPITTWGGYAPPGAPVAPQNPYASPPYGSGPGPTPPPAS